METITQSNPASAATALLVNGPKKKYTVPSGELVHNQIYLEAGKKYAFLTAIPYPTGSAYNNLYTGDGLPLPLIHWEEFVYNGVKYLRGDHIVYKSEFYDYRTQIYGKISGYEVSVSNQSELSISTENKTISEGGVFTFKINRESFGQTVDKIDWSIDFGGDFNKTDISGPSSGQVIFLPGEKSRLISIKTNNDKLIESDELLSVSVHGYNFSTGSNSTIKCKVVDNDFDAIIGGPLTKNSLKINSDYFFSIIDSTADQDWFSIDLLAGVQYKIEQISGLNSKLDSRTRIIDSSGKQVAFNDNSNETTNNSEINYTPNTGGKYYISAESSNQTIGSYGIKIKSENPKIEFQRQNPNEEYILQQKEGTSTSTQFSFTVTRSHGIGESSINYQVFFDAQNIYKKSTSASDFISKFDTNGIPIAPTGLITFLPGETTKTIAIGIVGDSTVEYDENFRVTLSNPVNATMGENINAFGKILNDDVATKSFADIFRAEGSVNNDGSTDGIFNAGKMRVMADFSKAAYALQPWETATAVGRAINDVSPGADAAYNSLIKQGWVPLDVAPTIQQTSLAVNNQMAGGYYTCGNAAALVMRCGDAVVISFRGTNDNAPQYSPNENKYDKQNIYHPDADQWGALQDGSSQSMTDHYNLFKNLLDSFDGYLNQNLSNLTKVFVTGHSLGGAMAIKYMSEHQHNIFESITYAAPSFTISDWLPQMFSKDTRITQVAIDEDPVPATWDAQRVIFGTYPPGRVITFYGTKTADEPDSQTGLGYVNIDNHSMDYYRQITKSVSSGGWQQILQGNNDRNVLIGATSGPYFNVEPKRHDPTQPGDQFDNIFVVDGTNSSNGAFSALLSNDEMPSNNYVDFYYGGVGNDAIRDSPGPDTIYAGSGNDFIEAKKEGLSDTIYTGTGKDIIKFYSIANLPDNIMDFTSKTDQIQVISANFGNMAPGVLSTSNFVAGVNPVARNTDPTFLFDKATGNLIFDSNGSATGGQSVLAHFEGAGVLSGTDILVVKS